jgi:hypothetical protein
MNDQEEWLTVAANAEGASWIGEKLASTLGVVGSLIPVGYESYVRIFHPVEDPNGNAVSWSQIADEARLPFSSTLQWDALATKASKSRITSVSSDLWEPERGSLDSSVFDSIGTVLRAFTPRPSRCFYGLWNGRTEARSEARAEGAANSPPVGIRSLKATPDIQGPVFEPWASSGRQYLLLEGSMVCARTLKTFMGMDQLSWMSPQFMWPQDQTWCLVTDIDFDSTLVGGSAAVAEALTSVPVVEALPISVNASLSLPVPEG